MKKCTCGRTSNLENVGVHGWICKDGYGCREEYTPGYSQILGISAPEIVATVVGGFLIMATNLLVYQPYMYTNPLVLDMLANPTSVWKTWEMIFYLVFASFPMLAMFLGTGRFIGLGLISTIGLLIYSLTLL